MGDTLDIDAFADDGLFEQATAEFSVVPSQPQPETGVQIAEKVAAEEGFTARDIKPAPKLRRSEFYRTGRSHPFAARCKPEDAARADTICNGREWVKGQLLEYALDALEEKIANPDDPFWLGRRYFGVD